MTVFARVFSFVAEKLNSFSTVTSINGTMGVYFTLEYLRVFKSLHYFALSFLELVPYLRYRTAFWSTTVLLDVHASYLLVTIFIRITWRELMVRGFSAILPYFWHIENFVASTIRRRMAWSLASSFLQDKTTSKDFSIIRNQEGPNSETMSFQMSTITCTALWTSCMNNGNQRPIKKCFIRQ